MFYALTMYYCVLKSKRINYQCLPSSRSAYSFVLLSGWFYHAPSRKKNAEPVIPPPLSQIPGLSNDAYLPPEEPPKGRWIKETDTRYVRLAKQGGRPDLLCSVTPDPPSTEPVGYPRVDWYYDNIAQGPVEQEDEYKYVMYVDL